MAVAFTFCDLLVVCSCKRRAGRGLLQGNNGLELEAASSQQTTSRPRASRRKRPRHGSLSSLMALSLANNLGASAEAQAAKQLAHPNGAVIPGRGAGAAFKGTGAAAADAGLTDSVHSHEDDTEALHKVRGCIIRSRGESVLAPAQSDLGRSRLPHLLANGQFQVLSVLSSMTHALAAQSLALVY